jgi:hypothetical protein
MKVFALAFVVTTFFFSINTSAQLYKQAAGIRIGPSSPAIRTGLTYRYFLNESTAAQGILSFGDGIGIAGLYEKHRPLNIESLQWFYGGGGYFASIDKEAYIGATGIVGVDYRFSQLPLNISLDWKPELNLIGGVYFEGATVGFSARYIF